MYSMQENKNVVDFIIGISKPGETVNWTGDFLVVKSHRVLRFSFPIPTFYLLHGVFTELFYKLFIL